MDKCLAQEDSGPYSSFIFVAKDGHSPCKLESHNHSRALPASANDNAGLPERAEEPASTKDTPILSERAEDSAPTNDNPILSERAEDSAATNDSLILSKRKKMSSGDFACAGVDFSRSSDW